MKREAFCFSIIPVKKVVWEEYIDIAFTMANCVVFFIHLLCDHRSKCFRHTGGVPSKASLNVEQRATSQSSRYLHPLLLYHLSHSPHYCSERTQRTRCGGTAL